MLRPALLVVCALLVALPAEAARVHVRGSAKLTARASRDTVGAGVAGGVGVANELILGGQLTDDAGQAIAGQPITIRVTRDADEHDPRVAEAMRGARRCERPGTGAHPSGLRIGGSSDAPEVVVTSDDEGRYCIRARLDPDRFKATLAYTPQATGPASLLDGATREIVFDLSKRGLELRFDPVPRIVGLDTPRAVFEAVAVLDADATPRVAPGLALVLSNEKEELARGTTNASGRARFAIDGQKVGAPGPGELRLSFAGDGETARAATSEDIERHVKVAVKIPAADRGELTPAIPEDGIALVAEVTSSAGPVPEGSVEARVGDVVVGAAPVDHGAARLLVTFTGHVGHEAALHMRYVPSSPWYEPLGEPVVKIPIRGPSIFAKAPILIAGLAMIAIFLFGRLSAQKNKPEPNAAEPKPAVGSDGKPRLEVVRAAARGDAGWSGAIVDAHEGQPLRGIRVWIERGTFDGRTILASAETTADGRFVLAGIGPVAGDETISAEGRYHARLTQPLPAPGEIALALAQRRRALLASLVKWAKKKGHPYDIRPEPTPGHVKRVGSSQQDTVRWAEAVERAAFGPGDVDARIEQEIEKLAPDDRRA